MNPGGHSLILRGNAGTGKTTFALQAIEDLAQIENSFYFSMRVSDHSLITQFPWLTEKLMPACGTADQKKEDVVGKHRSGLSKLKGLGMQSIGTAKKEIMSVVSGKLTVKLPGEAAWKDFGPGAEFRVAANQKFQLKVTVATAYLCLYL